MSSIWASVPIRKFGGSLRAPGRGLDWTVIRPPQLTDKPLSGSYRTAVEQNLRGGLSVPRADVAHFMLDVLGQPETVGRAIGIAR